MSSCAETEERSFEYQDCYVGYLDLWGYKAWIKEVVSNDSVSESLTGLREALKVLPLPGKTTCTDDYWVFAYSDSIILRQRPSGLDTFPLCILEHALTICYRMPIKTGLFVRGALQWGKFYGDDRIIFSPAYIEAVEWENKIAHHPRVLIDEVVVKRARAFLNDDLTGCGFSAPLALRDEGDGAWFVNYLAWDSVLREEDEDEADKWLGEHRKIILQRIGDTALPNDVRVKYMWLRQYHNRYCEHYTPTSVCDRMLIEQEFALAGRRG